MKKKWKKFVAGLLAAVMTVTALPVRAFAYMTGKPSDLTLTDINGNIITTDESWEETFPYGTFAFQNSQLIITEGGEPGVIQVYRLGGTTGRATAFIQYVPAMGLIGEDEYSYANAAGYGDLVIEVEDPLPIAAYQAVGREPAPYVPVPAVGVTVQPPAFSAEPEVPDEAGAPGETDVPEETGPSEEAELTVGDYILSVDVEADAWQWYFLSGGRWEEIAGAEDRTFVVDAESYDAYDFYCVYTLGGIRYGSDSAKGRAYTVDEEELETPPVGLELNPDPTYSTLEMDPNAPYSGYVFSMVFADGEWVKEIRISAPDDEDAEPDKFGTFTIIGCDGASLYDTANTLALHIIDDEAPEASQLGFKVTAAEFDKSGGTAVLTVRRTGGTQNVVSVDYVTEDGTARAGTDYSAVSGTLLFYSDVDEQTIEVPLIDNGEASEERRTFLVRLTGVRGGGEDGLCSLVVGMDVAEVSVYNTAAMEKPNLATLLYDSGAADISGNVTEGGGSVAPVDAGVITGEQTVEDAEGAVAEIGYGPNDIMPVTFQYRDPIRFSGTTNDPNYWHDYLTIVNGSGYNANSLGFPTTRSSWSVSGGTFEDYGTGLRLSNSNAATAALTISNMSRYYSSITARFEYKAKAASRWTQMWYGREYVYPWEAIQTGSGENFKYQSCNLVESGNWGNGYGTLSYDAAGTLSTSWSMSSGVSRLVMGLSRHDSKGSDGNAWVYMSNAVLQRRAFTRDLNLRIYTANDEDTAPDGGALLSRTPSVYNSLQPTVSIVQREGGANSGGHLYVGSKLKIDLKNTDTYSKAGESFAVYLTNSAGKVVATAAGDGGAYYLSLGFPKTESDLSEQYTLNVVMTRKQTITLDVSTSTDHVSSSPAYTAAWDRFKNSSDGAGYIEIGYSPIESGEPHFSAAGVRSETWSVSGGNTEAESWNGKENIQWINFHRSAEDRIVFNGRTYLGNERIWLTVADLSIRNPRFYYYHKDYLTSESIMTPTIDRIGLYLDADRNGRIDGYYNENTGYFELDADTKDRFVMFLKDGVDYDESLFAPVFIDGAYCQYFLKVFYTKTPRCLIPPDGVDPQEQHAQVLPAFISNITNSGVYASLTAEQKAYRYIIAGRNRTDPDDPYAVSSDNLPMYGGEATKMSVLDIPLGGDVNPPTENETGDGYTWTPEYRGNLLYPFADPEPIYIAHSLAGDNIPVAEVTGYDAGAFQYAEGGADNLNGYLGSFAGNSTVALCVQVQERTVPDIAAAAGAVSAWGVLPDTARAAVSSGADGMPAPEAVSVGRSGTFPDSEYLKANQAAGEQPNAGIDMTDSGNRFSEFNLDMGLVLPSTEIGITDYVTIIMDGYEVGFAIGLPLGGYESGEGRKSFKDTNTEDMGKIKDFLNGKKAKDVDDSFGGAMNSGKLQSRKFEVGFGMSMAFLFKYNPLDNTYYFSKFAMAISVELEFTQQFRLPVCPIVYMYVTVGIEVELGTGATVERISKTDGINLVHSGELPAGSTVKFATTYKAFDIDFDGKLLIELFSDADCTRRVTEVNGKDFSMGYITSDGSGTVSVTMVQKKGMDLGGSTEYYVRLTALEDTVITSVERVNEVKTLSYWNGFQLSPELYVEAGAGIGIEILKFEIFIKISIGCAMSMGVYNADTNGYDAFSFDEFNFDLGLGFRVVLLFFTYEMDLIIYHINYDKEKNTDGHSGWTHSWSALNGAYGGDIGEISLMAASGNTYGVRVKLPGSTADTQEIYSNRSNGIAAYSFKPADENTVPFELSGYGGSGDAFKLADGLTLGYDYRVVQAGGDNYVVYTLSRTGAAHQVDTTMLVMSRLRLTNADGKDVYGMVNPVDENNASTPYIMLDTLEGGADDGTGDLDFDVWVEGGTIHAAWVSYASHSEGPAKVTAPDETQFPRPTIPAGGMGPAMAMDQNNYTHDGFKPMEPTVVEEPGDMPVEPKREDYYLTEEEYEALYPDAQGKYVRVEAEAETDGAFYSIKGDDRTAKYPSLEDAEKAFEEAAGKYKEEFDSWSRANADYVNYQRQKAAYDTALAAYKQWFDYFTALNSYNAWVESVKAGAAKNTVVKTASFDTQGGIGFTAAKAVSGEPGSFVFLPNAVDGKVVIYGKSVHFEGTEQASKEAAFQTYLKSLYPDSGDQQEFNEQVRAFRQIYQNGLWNAYGKGSWLCVSADGQVKEIALNTEGVLNSGNGQILENIEAAKIGSAYYVAYTTSQQVIEGNDLKNIRRLYLRRLTINDGVVSAEAPLLLRTLYDHENNNDADGLYSSTSLTTRYDDPYFANLQFLTGKLGESFGSGAADETFTPYRLNSGTSDGAEAETFLLFEMNGSTYVIPEASLESIAESSTGKIVPFFKPDEIVNENGTVTPTSTGRSEVTIGADGAGNIAAVYVGTVPNTTNNAIYMTKWDPVSRTWGAGIMLAMNYMQVYEDAQANGWSPKETEAAYLGRLKTGNPEINAAEDYDGGGMDQFVFSNLQIALGQSKSDAGQSETDPGGGTDQMVVAEDENGPGPSDPAAGGPDENVNSTQSTKDTLLVLTQGSMTYLDYAAVDGRNVLIPLSDEQALKKWSEGGPRKPGIGLYAISYGVGNQSIGHSSLTFDKNDFTAGSRLTASLSFTNTGDVAIRASASNPAVVKLMLYIPGADAGTHMELAKWEIKESVRSGQEVRLRTKDPCAPLSGDLPNGSVFYIQVEEDKDYIQGAGGTAFSASTLGEDADGSVTGDLVVGAKVELALEDVDITAAGADAGGNTVLLVEFTAANRGNKEAEDVFVQFRYEAADGEEPANGRGPTVYYMPLDVSENTLAVSTGDGLWPADIAASSELSSIGILKLNSGQSGDTGNLPARTQRTVRGTVTVPASAYQGAVTGSLNLHLEIFSGEDGSFSSMPTETYAAQHNEYNSTNNVATRQIERRTFFTAADKLTIALGTTLRLPVSYTAAASGLAANISAEEVVDRGDPEKKLGVLYYSGSGGNTGMIVITPSREGTGIIHLKDERTNTIKPITFEVTPPGTGVDIYKDNHIFTFYNSDGSPYQETGLIGAQTWRFDDAVLGWGAMAAGTAEAPMRSTLSKGTVGSYFTFSTMAESIDLYFDGEAELTSNFPGFQPTPVTGKGGNKPTSIKLGSNPYNIAYTVTVKVTGIASGDNTYAWFDRLVEHYATEAAPTPSKDSTPPQIYWSRSFPAADSIQTGGGPVELTCFVLDDSTLASLTLDGAEPVGLVKNSGGFWQFGIEVTENGVFTVAALDSSGNRAVSTVRVNWFSDTPSSAGAGEVVLQGQFQDEAGNELEKGKLLGSGDKAFLAAVGEYPADSVFTAAYIAVSDEGGRSELITTSLERKEDGRFDATANGWYILRLEYGGGWRQSVLEMTQVDPEVPVVTLTESAPGEKWALDWSAMKNRPDLAHIAEVTINGCPLDIAASSTWTGGSWPIRFSGAYTLRAADVVGNYAEYTIEIANSRPLELSGAANLAGVTNSWDQAAGSGSVTVDLTGITGGRYDENASDPEQNRYVGSYDFCLVPVWLFDEYLAEKGIQGEDQEAARLETLLELKVGETLEMGDFDLEWRHWSGGDAVYDSLAPGEYRLYIRDALARDNENTAVANYCSFTIGNEAISFTAVSANASSSTAANGAITVEASGGRGGQEQVVYQFILRPLDSASGKLMAAGELAGESGNGPAYTWLYGDEDGTARRKVFDGLKSGWYQVAVRTMENVNRSDITYLAGLYRKMTGAQETYDRAVQAASESGIAAQVNQRIAEVQSALNAWNEALNDGAEDGSAGAAYRNLVNNDQGVLDALQAWRNAQSDAAGLGDISSSELSPEQQALINRVTAASDNYMETLREFLTGQIKPAAEGAVADAQTARDAAVSAYNAYRGQLEVKADEAFANDPALWDNAFTDKVYVNYNRPPVINNGGSNDNNGGGDSNSDNGDSNSGSGGSYPDSNNSYPDSGGSYPDSNDSYPDNSGSYPGSSGSYPGSGGSNSGNSGSNSGSWAGETDNKPVIRFTDVPADAYYAGAVAWAVEQGITLGATATTFAPNQPCTRAQIVTFLWRAAGSPKTGSSNPFTDVDSMEYYYDAVLWAVANGVTTGVTPTTFDPNAACTRAQAIAFIYRAQGSPAVSETGSFTDLAAGAYYIDAVEWAVVNGVTTGTSATTFSPEQTCTRAQIVTFLYRTYV